MSGMRGELGGKGCVGINIRGSEYTGGSIRKLGMPSFRRESGMEIGGIGIKQ